MYMYKCTCIFTLHGYTAAEMDIIRDSVCDDSAVKLTGDF